MTDQAMSPLRRRMIEDMTIRKFAPKTQHDYLQRVENFAAFLGRSPGTASFEDVLDATFQAVMDELFNAGLNASDDYTIVVATNAGPKRIT